MACNGSAVDFPCVGALEPTLRWRIVPSNIAGVIYTISPHSPHLQYIHIYVYIYIHIIYIYMYTYVYIIIIIIIIHTYPKEVNLL